MRAGRGVAGLRLRLTESDEASQLAIVWQLWRGFAGLTLVSNPYELPTFSVELYLFSNPRILSTYCVQDTVTVHAMGFLWRRYLL